MRLMLAIALASLLLSVSGAAEARTPRVPAGWAGVAVDGPLLEEPQAHRGEWRRMHDAHVGFIRVSFPWRVVEQQPGAIDLSYTDGIVLRAARRGFTVLPEVHGTPPWAAKHPRHDGSRPRNPEDFAPVLRAMVRRYGRDGTLWSDHPFMRARPIRRWQIWNEQNIKAYWTEQPFAKKYVELLRVAHRVLEDADPGAELILGGMPNRSWEALHAIYDEGGGELFDAVALHPYANSVGDALRVLHLVRNELDARGTHEKDVYLTEVSWPASARHNGVKPNGFETDNRTQAKRLRRFLLALAAERESSRIAGVVWYTWLSKEGYGRPSWAPFTGLRRLRGDRVFSTPALKAFRRTVGQLRRR